MTFLDVLNEAAEISETALIKFFQYYKIREKTLHVFFEGSEDQSFYSNYIEQIYGIEIKHYYYISNGKDNVFQNYQDIDWTIYNKNRVLFFVDNDFDDLLSIERVKDENIFVTKYYSVENYIVTANILEKLLREFCFVNDEDFLSKLKIQFNKELIQFANMMITISSWAIYCRRNSLPLNLSDITLTKLFYIDNEFKIRKATFTKGNSAFNYICNTTKTAHFNFIEILKTSRLLTNIQNPKFFLRGKYELWFFYNFYNKTVNTAIPALNLQIKEHNKASSRKIPKCKIMVQVTMENILLLAAPKLLMPSDLQVFLNFNFKKLT